MKTEHNEIMSKRISDAYELFNDIEELFEDPNARFYLTSILTEDEFNSMIEEFSICFTENNDKEKVLTINIWKNMVA